MNESAAPSDISTRHEALALLFAEYDAYRRTMDNHASLAVQGIGVLLTLTGVAATIGFTSVKTPLAHVDSFLTFSTLLAAVAWAVLIQFWRMLWCGYYIATELRRHITEVLADGSLEDKYLRSMYVYRAWRHQPKQLTIPLLVSGGFLPVLLLFPSVAFIIAPGYYSLTFTHGQLAWGFPEWSLLVLSVAASLALLIGTTACMWGVYVATRKATQE